MITYKCDWCGGSAEQYHKIVSSEGNTYKSAFLAIVEPDSQMYPISKRHICRACLIKELQKES